MVIQLNVLRGMGGGVQVTMTIGMVLIVSACLISEGFCPQHYNPKCVRAQTLHRQEKAIHIKLTLLSLKAHIIYALAKSRFGRF